MATAGKDLSAYKLDELYRPGKERVAICVANWNEEITGGLADGALAVLKQLLPPSQISIHKVPGAFELPLGAQFLFEQQKVDAVICIGSVIRGETAHFDYVCGATSHGVLEVGLKYNAPCIFCVLTDDTIDQSRARSGGIHGNKGTEADVAAIQMLGLKAGLQ